MDIYGPLYRQDRAVDTPPSPDLCVDLPIYIAPHILPLVYIDPYHSLCIPLPQYIDYVVYLCIALLDYTDCIVVLCIYALECIHRTCDLCIT